MDTKILGFSGYKQGGKNTSTNFLVGSFMKSLEIIQGDFKITPRGELWVPDILGDTVHQGIFDILSNTTGMTSFKAEYLNDIIKVYSYADILKEVCINILGLSWEQCYGTDADKNSLTKLKWEDMPGVVHEPGFMTGREVMQIIGTEVFRKMYSNVWVDATIKRINNDAPLMAVICDLRFPNEVDAILDVASPDTTVEGKVIRLLRNPSAGQDVHESETALDNYPTERYSAVLDNSEMTVAEQNEAVKNILTEWSWFPKPFNGVV